MTSIAVEPEPDLDQLERDAARRVEELRSQHGALSLDALTDQDAAVRLRSLEADAAAAETALLQVRAARVELEKRRQAAREKEQESLRAEALHRARELQAAREKAAHSYDSACRRAAVALKAWRAAASEQELCLRRAGRDATAARARGWMPEVALIAAMRAVGCPEITVGALSGPGRIAQGFIRPLSESDPVPIEGVKR